MTKHDYNFLVQGLQADGSWLPMALGLMHTAQDTKDIAKYHFDHKDFTHVRALQRNGNAETWSIIAEYK
jgi:hypothetical protein